MYKSFILLHKYFSVIKMKGSFYYEKDDHNGSNRSSCNFNIDRMRKDR